MNVMSEANTMNVWHKYSNEKYYYKVALIEFAVNFYQWNQFAEFYGYWSTYSKIMKIKHETPTDLGLDIDINGSPTNVNIL